MNIYHATPEWTRCWIERDGLDPAFSRTRARVIWLAGPDRSYWAAQYCRRRHRVPGSQAVLVYRVKWPKAKLHEAGRQIWWSYDLIPPEALELAIQYGPGGAIIV